MKIVRQKKETKLNYMLFITTTHSITEISLNTASPPLFSFRTLIILDRCSPHSVYPTHLNLFFLFFTSLFIFSAFWLIFSTLSSSSVILIFARTYLLFNSSIEFLSSMISFLGVLLNCFPNSHILIS